MQTTIIQDSPRSGPQGRRSDARARAPGWRRAGPLAGLLASLLLLFGCAAAPVLEKPPTSLVLGLEAAEDSNPNSRGRPSPVVLRVYELKDSNTFSTASYVSMIRQDEVELGPDLVYRRVLRPLAPGTSSTETYELDDATRFVGVLAEFSDHRDGTARAVQAVRLNRENVLTVRIVGNQILLEGVN